MSTDNMTLKSTESQVRVFIQKQMDGIDKTISGEGGVSVNWYLNEIAAARKLLPQDDWTPIGSSRPMIRARVDRDAKRPPPDYSESDKIEADAREAYKRHAETRNPGI